MIRYALSSLLAIALASAAPQASQTKKSDPPAAPAADMKKKAAATKPAPMPPPSAADIAAAKSKGLVWVNLNTGVYHKDGNLYGKTKNGQFMTEDDAKKAGHRAAKESPIGHKQASPAKK